MPQQVKALLARAASAVKRIAVFALRPFRRILGRLFQFVEQDELRALRHETARLSSASVESVTYLGSELRAVDERLSQLEEDLGAVRRLLEASGSDSGPESKRASTPAAPSA